MLILPHVLLGPEPIPETRCDVMVNFMFLMVMSPQFLSVAVPMPPFLSPPLYLISKAASFPFPSIVTEASFDKEIPLQ